MINIMNHGRVGGALPLYVRARTAADSVTPKVFTAAEYPAMRPITPWMSVRCVRRIWTR